MNDDLKPQGKFLGIPYDWRRPTKARFLSRVWNPDAPLINARWYGWGYDLNFYRLLRIKLTKLILAILVGLLLGFLGSRVLLLGSALSLIPWAVVGLAFGYFIASRGEAIINGALYGFSLAFFFMLFGYNGSASLVSRLPFFAILGIVGAVCGLILSIIGNFTKARVRKS